MTDRAPWLNRFHRLHDWCLQTESGSGPVPERSGLQGSLLPEGLATLAGDLAGPRCVGVSACLLGIRSRYDGKSKPVPGLAERLSDMGLEVIPVCPEVLAGLGVPRPPMHFEGGDGRALLAGHAELLDIRGRSCGEAMRLGAARALHLTKGCGTLLLKERSPSCGLREVHVGEDMVPGMGVFAAMAAEKKKTLFSEDDLEAFFRETGGPAGRQ